MRIIELKLPSASPSLQSNIIPAPVAAPKAVVLICSICQKPKRRPGPGLICNNCKFKNGVRHRQALWTILAEGGTIKTAATALKLSAKTVEYHFNMLKRETGLDSIALLTQKALKDGIARWMV